LTICLGEASAHGQTAIGKLEGSYLAELKAKGGPNAGRRLSQPYAVWDVELSRAVADGVAVQVDVLIPTRIDCPGLAWRQWGIQRADGVIRC
jgi:hypothetical protein